MANGLLPSWVSTARILLTLFLQGFLLLPYLDCSLQNMLASLHGQFRLWHVDLQLQVVRRISSASTERVFDDIDDGEPSQCT